MKYNRTNKFVWLCGVMLCMLLSGCNAKESTITENKEQEPVQESQLGQATITEAAVEPTAEPTKAPEETLAPEPTQIELPEPTVSEEAVTLEPTITPEETVSAEVTEVPEKTETPEVSEEVSVTATPEPTATPKPTEAPTATPKPTVAPTKAPVKTEQAAEDLFTYKEITEEEYTYIDVKAGELVITGVKDKNVKNLVVPATINGKKVKGIGIAAFAKLYSLESVVISEGIEALYTDPGYAVSPRPIVGCFEDCINLQKVTLPESLKKIEGYAFYGCSKLKEIKLPSGIERLDWGTFANCTSLKSIEIPSEATILGTGNSWSNPTGTFEGCTSLETIVFSEKLQEIGKKSFYKCSSLKKVDLPDSLVTIGKSAFSECKSLTGIEIPKNVAYIEHPLPDYEVGEKMVWGDGVSSESINAARFVGNSSMKYIQVSKENQVFASVKDCLLDKEKKVLISVPSRTTQEYFIVPDGVEVIANEAFMNCETIEIIHISSSVQMIESNAFDGCVNLACIEVSPDNEFFTWDMGVLYSSDGTELIRVPQQYDEFEFSIAANITKIYDGAFSDCKNLEYITVEFENEQYDCLVSDGVLFNAEHTALIKVPEGYTQTSYEIDENISQIYPGAFDGCSNLQRIEVSPGNQYFTSVDGILYDKNKTELIRIPEGHRGEAFEIPAGVYVHSGFGKNCTNVKKLVTDVASIFQKNSVTFGFTNLKEIQISDGGMREADLLREYIEELRKVTIIAEQGSVVDEWAKVHELNVKYK